MEEQGKPRELIRLMYGEQAEAMNEVAGERLRRWAQGFDEWLGKMVGKTGLRLRKEARLSWRYFTQSYRGAPWAASTADVERWMEQLLQRGLGIITVRHHLRNASFFYKFMGENGRDPELEAGYNPVTGVRTPQWRPYRNASTLSPEAAQALLKAVDRASEITR